mmetsp:Transcript_15/g.41  ORF Transcript_15/g.41 Transcript_15/m.41 type:complete len:202 (-) Transcript_15:458-1063(-)
MVPLPERTSKQKKLHTGSSACDIDFMTSLASNPPTIAAIAGISILLSKKSAKSSNVTPLTSLSPPGSFEILSCTSSTVAFVLPINSSFFKTQKIGVNLQFLFGLKFANDVFSIALANDSNTFVIVDGFFPSSLSSVLLLLLLSGACFLLTYSKASPRSLKKYPWCELHSVKKKAIFRSRHSSFNCLTISARTLRPQQMTTS